MTTPSQKSHRASAAVTALALLAGIALAPDALAGEHKLSNLSGNLPFTLLTNENFGRSVAALGDYDGDGVEDIAVGTSLHLDLLSLVKGGVYLLFMNPDGTVKSHAVIDNSTAGLSGQLPAESGFGDSVALIGDIDGNGVRDFIVGAPRDDDGNQDAGAVWVLRMNTDHTVLGATKISALGGNAFPWSPLPLGGFWNNFGASVAGGLDLDGDGQQNDVVVGMPNYQNGRGAALVLPLNAQGQTLGHVLIANGAGGFSSPIDTGDLLGKAVAVVADHDGNGVDDILVSAPGDDQQGLNMGCVYRMSLNVGGSVLGYWKMVENNPPFSVPPTSSQWGASLATGADLNGDGSHDILVGEAFKDGAFVDQGGLWLVFANLDQQPLRWDEIGESGESLDLDFESGGQLGRSVALIGDLNDDGQQDWAVGAPNTHDQFFGSGSVWIVLSEPGSHDWTTSFTDLGQALNGDTEPRMFIPGVIVHPYWTLIEVRHTVPGSQAWLVVGASNLSASFKAGVLVPNPDLILDPLTTNALGQAAHSVLWPAGLPSGFELFFQYWMPDVSGPAGFTASNAVMSTEP